MALFLLPEDIDLSWVIFSFIASILNATVIQLNHHFKIDGLVLAVYKNLVAFILIAVCAAPFITWDFSLDFYLTMILAGFIGVFVDILIFNAAATYGSRLASLYMTVRILSGFVVWLILSETAMQSLLGQPFVMTGVVFCLLLSCAAVFMMRAHDASWKAFLAVAPAGVMLMIIDTIVKVQIDGAPMPDAAVAACTVSFGSLTLFASLALYWRDKQVLAYALQPHIRKGCFYLGAVFCSLILCINLAQTTTPNPAYLNAIILTSILWLMIYHKWKKIPDDANPWVGVLFLISALGIVLLTA